MDEFDSWDSWDSGWSSDYSDYQADPETYLEQGGDPYSTGFGEGGFAEPEGGWVESNLSEGDWSPSESFSLAGPQTGLFPTWTEWQATHPLIPGNWDAQGVQLGGYWDYMNQMGGVNPNLPGWSNIYGGIENIPSYVDITQAPPGGTITPEMQAQVESWAAATGLAPGRTVAGGSLVFGSGGQAYNPEWLTSVNTMPGWNQEWMQGRGYVWNPFTADWEETLSHEVPSGAEGPRLTWVVRPYYIQQPMPYPVPTMGPPPASYSIPPYSSSAFSSSQMVGLGESGR